MIINTKKNYILSPDLEDWIGDGITRRNPRGRHFGRAYHDAVENASTIHFSLDGIDDIDDAILQGKNIGFVSTPRIRNMTNAELQYLSTRPDLLKKTIFYRNLKPVPSPF